MQLLAARSDVCLSAKESVKERLVRHWLGSYAAQRRKDDKLGQAKTNTVFGGKRLNKAGMTTIERKVGAAINSWH